MKDNQMYEVILSASTMDSSYITKAREEFEKYRDEHILYDCEFESTFWKIDDEYSRTTIYFDIDSLCYDKWYKNIFKLSYSDFIEYEKTYVISILGNYGSNEIQRIAREIKHMVSCNPFDLKLMMQKLSSIFSNIIDFLSVLPNNEFNDELDKLIDNLEEVITYNYSNYKGEGKRNLASFESYFLFNDLLNEYWKMKLDYDERLFYYPLYLWWKISGVIPLRPREFILTPRECLVKKQDGYYLKLRRNKIKGSTKSISYRIDSDYEIYTYKIPDSLANEILIYKNFTSNYDKNELDTLFIADSHYKKWCRVKPINSRFFTYVNIHTVLRYFFYYIIEGKFGYKVIYDNIEGILKDNTIQYIQLGDTRHIALINIIAEGGTPVIAMLLAGHDNTNMAAHYYTNITSLIECKTYQQYKKYLKGNIEYETSKINELVQSCNFLPIENGAKCYSVVFAEGKIDDCLKVCGPNGEIGYCPNCKYYRSESATSFFGHENIYKRKIEDSCKHLELVIRQARLYKEHEEDIVQALLRLQSDAYSYQKYCEERLKNGEKQ